jgi:hypothetical protein
LKALSMGRSREGGREEAEGVGYGTYRGMHRLVSKKWKSAEERRKVPIRTDPRRSREKLLH